MKDGNDTNRVHVFFVHSHISFICAMGIIRTTEIEPDDVRLVFLRDYSVATPFRSTEFPFPANRNSPSQFFGLSAENIRQSRARLRKLDGFVSEITDNRTACFYFPQTRRDFYHLLITHPDITAFSIMEEGRWSRQPVNGYARKDAEGLPETLKLAFKRAILPLIYGKRARSKGEFAQGFAFVGRGAEAYFGLSEDAFPGAPRRHIIDLAAACEAAAEFLEAPDLPPGTLVLVLADLLFSDTERKERYLRTLKTQIETGKTMGLGSIAYKFHPAPSPNRAMIADHIRTIAEDAGLSVQELGKNVSLELLALRTPDLTFAGSSSATDYAVDLGAKQLDYD